ncbi:MAG: hypothetical protein LWW87_14690 [Geobacteraceae bacterium]|nr:hypothetical protein [Geobacteraceae bacterium]
MSTTDASYYITTALQALEAAYRTNNDTNVANHLSQALDALHRLNYQQGKQPRMYRNATSDPYEMDEFNSAV